MAITNLTGGGSQTATFVEVVCSSSFTSGIRQELVYLPPVNILLSLTSFLGNALILVALHKESSLHPPSKLLYRCLATTDLCVGLVSQPLVSTYWMSVVHEDWSFCRYAFGAAYITGYALCMVSLLTLTAISVDRLLALLLELRYRQVVTLNRTYIVVATFWVVSGVAALCYIIDHRIAFRYGYIIIAILSSNLNRLVHKDFPRAQKTSQSSTKSCWTATTEPTKCTEHCAIPKGSVQCTVGAVSISCLLSAI